MKLRFVPDKKRIAAAAILIVLTLAGTRLVPDVPVKFALAAGVLFAAAACLRLEARGWAATLVMGLFACGSALLTVLLCQFVNNLRGRPGEHYYVLLGCLCFLLAALVLHLILLCFTRISVRPAVILVSAALLTLAVANRFVYEFRGSALNPLDLLSVQTAANVVGSYHLNVDKNILYAIVFFALEIFFAAAVRIEDPPRISLRRITVLALALVLGAYVHVSLGKIMPSYWGNIGAYNLGFVVNFSRELRDCVILKPKGYGSGEIRALEQRYEESAGDDALPEKLPHIIVIMNESFTDFRVFGEVETDEPVTPFLDSLQENTVRGFALSSVYGARTPNSEYEFLTGNSLAFFSPSSIVFSGLDAPCYSLTRYLDSLGYDSYGTHPEPGSNWWRDKVYPLLGFNECRFREDYPEVKRVNDWALDEAVYDNLIRTFENAGTDAPQFLFVVTSQNHSPYGEGGEEDFPPIPIKGFDGRKFSAFLARMHESDRALQKLIGYFETVEEPVLIMLYGDHQPYVEMKGVEYLYGAPLESLDEQELMYEIPFFIWANYDIEEQRPELTSINYLSNFLLETAGLPLPPYNRFLADIERTIPAINAEGYYSLSEGRFLKRDEAQGAEKQALQEYEILQYNATHDEKGRSSFFFPVND